MYGEIKKACISANENFMYIKCGRWLELRVGEIDALIQMYASCGKIDATSGIIGGLEQMTAIFWTNIVIGLGGSQQIEESLFLQKLVQGRIDYINLGDVVLFDNMHKRNESKWPFVSFIDWDNHFEFVFPCYAFVFGGTKVSYVWVPLQLLRLMHMQDPKVFLINQYPELGEVVAEVLLGSRRCICLWLVLKKILEKLGYVIKQHENFVSTFHKCILKFQTAEQFEIIWRKVVDRFKLRAYQWVDFLHDDWLRWVLVDMKHIVFVGLSSPQCLENIVYLVDQCFLQKTSLKEFLHQYNVVLQEKYEAESKAEFYSWHKQLGLKSPSLYGKQMVQIYTIVVFKKFHVVVLGVVACHPKIVSGEAAFGKCETINNSVQIMSDLGLNSLPNCVLYMLGLLPSDQFQVVIDALWEPLSKSLISSTMIGYTFRNADQMFNRERNFEIHEVQRYILRLYSHQSSEKGELYAVKRKIAALYMQHFVGQQKNGLLYYLRSWQLEEVIIFGEEIRKLNIQADMQAYKLLTNRVAHLIDVKRAIRWTTQLRKKLTATALHAFLSVVPLLGLIVHTRMSSYLSNKDEHDMIIVRATSVTHIHAKLLTCMIARGALVKLWIFTVIKEQRHWDIAIGRGSICWKVMFVLAIHIGILTQKELRK